MWMQDVTAGPPMLRVWVSWLFTLAPQAGSITLSQPFSRGSFQVAGAPFPGKDEDFLVHQLPHEL